MIGGITLEEDGICRTLGRIPQTRDSSEREFSISTHFVEDRLTTERYFLTRRNMLEAIVNEGTVTRPLSGVTCKQRPAGDDCFPCPLACVAGLAWMAKNESGQ